MTIPKDNTQLENARRLRREMTPHERKLQGPLSLSLIHIYELWKANSTEGATRRETGNLSGWIQSLARVLSMPYADSIFIGLIDKI